MFKKKEQPPLIGRLNFTCEHSSSPQLSFLRNFPSSDTKTSLPRITRPRITAHYMESYVPSEVERTCFGGWCCLVVFFFKFYVSKCFFLSECWTTFELKVGEGNLRVRRRTKVWAIFCGFLFFRRYFLL